MEHQLHIVFFPFMAQGHIIPTLDMAMLFSSRGLKTTIVTTTLDAHEVTRTIERTIERTKQLGNQTAIRVIKFPAVQVGLPEKSESIDQLPPNDVLSKIIKAIPMLQQPFEQTLQELSPDCLVADLFFPWAADVAAKFDIPRLVFNGSSLFARCASENLTFHKPFKNVSSDSQPFVLPHFPHEIEFTKVQVPEFELGEGETNVTELQKQAKESEKRSFGIIVNSFNELEKDYVDYYRKVWERRAWLIGPLSLCNREAHEDKAQRGKQSSIDEHECLQWLDSRKPKSVIYVCFGSVAPLSASQLHEIALGLEASGQQFIWVVKKRSKDDEEDDGKWLPQGFEERIKDKGLIIRGWAPQVLILEHEATGAFITHCGWNSALEGVCAGVPMATWPTFAEQPFNEKLLTQVLKIGIVVGSPLLNRAVSGVKREEVADAVKRVMEGEEALEMRGRAKALQEMAGKAVEEGGSSYNNLSSLIEELKCYR